MSNHGHPHHHQHHHCVNKKIVEGIGGIMIGTAAVLLLTSFFKSKKAKPRAAATHKIAPITKPASAESAD